MLARARILVHQARGYKKAREQQLSRWERALKARLEGSSFRTPGEAERDPYVALYTEEIGELRLGLQRWKQRCDALALLELKIAERLKALKRRVEDGREQPTAALEVAAELERDLPLGERITLQAAHEEGRRHLRAVLSSIRSRATKEPR